VAWIKAGRLVSSRHNTLTTACCPFGSPSASRPAALDLHNLIEGEGKPFRSITDKEERVLALSVRMIRGVQPVIECPLREAEGTRMQHLQRLECPSDRQSTDREHGRENERQCRRHTAIDRRRRTVAQGRVARRTASSLHGDGVASSRIGVGERLVRRRLEVEVSSWPALARADGLELFSPFGPSGDIESHARACDPRDIRR
jgi:hypothetical protein